VANENTVETDVLPKENSPQNLAANAAVPFNPKDNGIATTCS
jgi:hypothetical protein